MFDLSSLKGKKASVTICENSIIILMGTKKIVLIAQRDDYAITIDPPGVRGCDQPVDEFGQVVVTDESVFENGLLYRISNIIFEGNSFIENGKICCSQLSLSLCDSKGDTCTVLISSPQIFAEIVEIYDFNGLIGEQVQLKLVENHLTIKQRDIKWSFLAQSDNYVVRIERETMSDRCYGGNEMSSVAGDIFENGVPCTITDFQYYDDMLGETTIEFNLYFTNLSITFQTDDQKNYCLEIDTAKMKIDQLSV